MIFERLKRSVGEDPDRKLDIKCHTVLLEVFTVQLEPAAAEEASEALYSINTFFIVARCE